MFASCSKGVPALLPIVEHVFLATIYIDGKQVEAQREVVISMLLRIAEHHQVSYIVLSNLYTVKS